MSGVDTSAEAVERVAQGLESDGLLRTANFLRALAERAEQAAGADRELDALVHCAVTGRKLNPFLPEGYTIRDLGSEAKNALLARSAFITENRGPAPSYTASLDAAAALVPAGWVSRHEWDGGAGDPAWSRLTLGQRLAVEAKALTPALALTAAALRARAEEADDAG